MNILTALLYILIIITCSNCSRNVRSEINGVDLNKIEINVERDTIDIVDIGLFAKSAANIDMFICKINGETRITVKNGKNTLWETLNLINDNTNVKIIIDNELLVCVDDDSWEKYLKNVESVKNKMLKDESGISLCGSGLNFNEMIEYLRTSLKVEIRVSENIKEQNKIIDAAIILNNVNVYKVVCWLSALVNCNVRIVNDVMEISSIN